MATFDCRQDAAARNVTLGPLGIDYEHLHYCVFEGVPELSFVLQALWLVLLFLFLASIADGYFSPTLASLSDKLHVPYHLAGVTFLAFGNGAPDVFASIAAFASGVPDTGVNELLGGAMFILNVVVGCVALVASFQVQNWAFSRDIVTLVMALLLLVIIQDSDQESGKPSVRGGGDLILLVMYAIYVSSAVVPQCFEKLRTSDITPHKTFKSGVQFAFWHSNSRKTGSSRQSNNNTRYAFITRGGAKVGEDEDEAPGLYELGDPMKQEAVFSTPVFEDHFEDTETDSLTSPLIADEERTVDSLEDEDDQLLPVHRGVAFSRGGSIIEAAYYRHLRWRWRMQRRYSCFRRGHQHWIMWIINIPNAVLVGVRNITVPLLDHDSWSRSLVAITPVTVPQLFLALSGHWNDHIWARHLTAWMLALAIGVAVSIAVFCTTHRSRPPTSTAYCLCFLAIAFSACVCWIYAIANEVVALLVAVGKITHASNSLLGLTVLSWGNSLPDLITNVSIARAGFPEMAIGGCYGGPVFNILLGLGIPLALAFVEGRPVQFLLDAHAWISMGFLLCTLLLTYWVFRWNQFRCPGWYGKMLLVNYLAYTVVNVVIALYAE